LPSVALAASTSALAALAAVVLGIESRQPVYIMPISVVAVAAICVVLTVIGGAVAVRRRRVTPWLAPAVTGVLLVASLELFFITIPLLVILLILISVRALRRGLGRIPADQSVGAPGFLLTVGLVPLFLLILLGRPVVECISGGGSSGIPVWAWVATGAGGPVSGSGSGSSNSTVSTGMETANGTTYSWVCEGSNVVQFTTKRSAT
jgi:hypothetical protein